MKGAANLLKMLLLSYKGKMREGALGQSKVSLVDSKQQAATAGLCGDVRQLKALLRLNYGSKMSTLILICLHSVCRSAGELGEVMATSLSEQLVVTCHHPPPFMSLLFQYGRYYC